MEDVRRVHVDIGPSNLRTRYYMRNTADDQCFVFRRLSTSSVTLARFCLIHSGVRPNEERVCVPKSGVGLRERVEHAVEDRFNQIRTQFVIPL